MKRDPKPGAVPGAISVNEGPTHSPEGVDLTLIRWMLSLTPLERLLALQSTIESIRSLRGETAED